MADGLMEWMRKLGLAEICDEEGHGLLGRSLHGLGRRRFFPLFPRLGLAFRRGLAPGLPWGRLGIVLRVLAPGFPLGRFTAGDVNFAVVRPCVVKWARLNNLATVYALFVVRGRFLTRIESDLANAGIWSARAMFCELVATKVLRRFATSGPYELVAALTTSWDPLAGASESAVQSVRDIIKDEDDMFQPASALEAAISTKAKHFLSSALVQKVIYDIWSGNIEFSTLSTRAVLADNYKTRQIEFYDCMKGPVLNHYRLRVPKYGAILEFLNFAVLFVTFLLCMFNQDLDNVTVWEIVLSVMAIAFALEEYTAAQEHGLNTITQITIFLFYVGYRLQGLLHNDRAASDLAFDILACEALILFPRYDFALQGMIKEFCFFIFLAAICFSGLLFTLWKLAAGTWKVKAIAWLMVQIWFGNTYLSFQQAESFHPLFGPILMVMFAAMANTLLITILISILSNTFSRIDANANQEYLFQFAVTTMEGVKGDALFCYQPPFNLLAYAILYPASFILDAHAFHRLNVFLMRLTCFPILLVITAYERYFARGQKWRESSHDVGQSIVAALPRSLKHSALFEAVVGSQSNVEVELIEPEEDESDEGHILRSYASRETFHRESPYQTPGDHTPIRPSRRATSLTPQGGASPLRNNFPLPGNGDRARPLARLFARRPVSEAFAERQLDAVSRRLEQVADNMKDLQVHRIKDDMKELQERQARIENLLMMLTRGMRGEGTVGTPNSIRR
ncbi:hypothetical protein EXIGLDRAFT_739859 [Exidia glandulosa HHB12029]|uniref:Polycystin cation channel PKD1/PKD2 domain-containing protein n=1 Tax=Exidia glandulosa HHB12029 TaxID=1314781 RepID=A0A165JDY4_EXIGL|nr:hypothetical protein EXIGLDRAFT_739859 [Exidia glandulosa HHB12029]